MPDALPRIFAPEDAIHHTSLADSMQLAQRWANVANYYMRQTKGDEVTAVRKANYDIARRKGRVPREPKEQQRLRRYGQRSGWLNLGG
jgi:hypothetical protein